MLLSKSHLLFKQEKKLKQFMMRQLLVMKQLTNN